MATSDWITEVANKPVFDIRTYGAVSSTPQTVTAAIRTANDTAFRNAIRAASPNAGINPDTLETFPNAIAEPRGGMVFVPFGIWYLSAAIELDREVVIQGVSGAGREGAGSVLRFPNGVTGIIVQRYNTSDLEQPTSEVPGRFRQGRGDYSVIRDVSLEAEGRTSAADGVRMYARAAIENCFIRNFGRDGIHIGTDATEENVINPANNSLVTNLNADNWQIINVRVESCVRHGIYVSGVNSNAGRAIGADCSQNGDYGINDTSFLGNTYEACHMAGNGPSATDRRGLRTFGGNNRCLLENCYTEGDQKVDLNVATQVVGGTFGGSAELPPLGGQQWIFRTEYYVRLRDLAGDPSFLIRNAPQAPNKGQVGIRTEDPNSPLHVQGTIATAVAVKTSANNNNVLSEQESVILADASTAAFNLNLPLASTCMGRQYTIKKIDASTNTVTVRLISGSGDTIRRVDQLLADHALGFGDGCQRRCDESVGRCGVLQGGIVIKSVILRCLLVGLFCVVQCNTGLQKARADVVLIKELSGTSWAGSAVNTSTNEVYAPNFVNRSVDVINGTSNTVTATIGLTTTPQIVAVDSSRNKVYATDEGRNVVVIDGATKRQLTLIMVGRNPRGIAVNSATSTVYVANRGDNSLSVIDGVSNTVVATVAVGRGPTSVAVNEATNRIYVTNSSDNSLSVIDGVSNTVVATVAVGRGPTSVAVNEATNRIYVMNSMGDGLSVIDGATNIVVATVRTSGSPDSPGSVAVNPRINRIYVSNLGVLGSLTVLDGVDNTIIQTLRLGTDTLSLTVNENTGFIYASGSAAGSRSVFILRDDPNFDQARPTVAIISPTNGARLTSLSSVTGTALDNRGGSGISRVALFLKRSSDGKYWTGRNWSTTQTELRTTLGAFNANGQTFTNADPLPSGENLKQDTYFLSAVAIDRANAFGNRAVRTVSFRVIDVIDPQIAITYPSDGALLSQLTKISGTLTDNAGGSGPSRVLLQIRRSSDRKYFDGTMWTSSAVTLSTELIGSGEAVAWQRIGGLPPVVSGRDVYTISAIGYDRAFNRDDATVTITVGTAATAT